VFEAKSGAFWFTGAMKEITVVTEGQYRNQVVQYDPNKILELCNRLSVKLTKENKTIIGGNWPSRLGSFIKQKAFHITQHKLALLAMISIQNYRYAHGKAPSNREFVALANNVSTIHNPIDEKEPIDSRETLFSTMVRLAYQQFPFQEGIFDVLPRHLLLYLYSKVKTPSIQIDTEAYKNFGLHIIDYMTIGFAFFAASLQQPVFQKSFIENTLVKSIKKRLTPENVENFLSRTAADFDTFRNMCLREIAYFPDGGTYRFNPLFDRPIIIRRDGGFCVPIPMLIPNVITKGLYYDFLDLFSSETGNQFAEWFGHAFECYGGLLLKNTFGKQNVFQEPVYGKEHKRGPDWTIMQGDSAIALEFRSGRLNKKTKVYGDYSDIADLVERNILTPLKKFPDKIMDIKSGLTNIPATIDTEFFPCIVNYEPLYSNQLFMDIIQRELKKASIPEFDFELMSIEDLEWLLAWAKYENPVDFLKAKRANLEWKIMSVRGLIEIKMKESNIQDIRNLLLNRVFDKFWKQTFPELAQRQSN
jgi:hypothetical protein